MKYEFNLLRFKNNELTKDLKNTKEILADVQR